MPTFSKITRVTALIAVLSVFGAGCSKSLKLPKATDQKTGQEQPLLFPPDAKANPTINDELRNILKNFRDAKSFRAKMTLKSVEGVSSAGVFEYLKPARVRGLFSNGTDLPSEFVLIEDKLYIKIGANWQDLSKLPAAKAMGELLKKGLSQPTQFQDMGVTNETVVSKARDASRNCDLYHTSVKGVDGSTANFDLCAVDGKPKFLTMQLPQGTLSVEYYDFGANFLIEKPAIKK